MSMLRDPIHGPLPVLLLALTATTGLIDAVSILALGRVFVANMTGNVAFLGFALAGAPGFSLSASLAALAGFLVGAAVGGAMAGRTPDHRGLLLRNACALQFAVLAAALAILLPASEPLGSGVRAVVAALCAIAMGLQTSAARRLGVPDLTTTVLTMTLTGIAADIRRSPTAATARRLLAVLTMLAGAVGGTLLVLHVRAAAALAVALVLLGGVVAAAARASRTPADWQAQQHA
jgi:uncharacterized membrane protein YoaK (UPF0700 family)